MIETATLWTVIIGLGLGSFALPTGQLMIWIVVAAVAGLLASVLPARKAARMDVLNALSYQ